ncbi:vWA domain-containing protein [Pseudobacillus badius]|uniref:vWA domain-containing protein n=1 Tax=Bacillus badius TaxID=1455 RepID=UPI003CF0846C
MDHISGRVSAFCRYLRSRGFVIGLKEIEDSLRALSFVDISKREQFQLALKLVLCSSKEEQVVFDEAFQLFFVKTDKSQPSVPLLASEKPEGGGARGTATEKSAEGAAQTGCGKEGMNGSEEADSVSKQGEAEQKAADGERETAFNWLSSRTASQRPGERHVYISPSGLSKMEKAARKLVRQVQLKQARRLAAGEKGRQLDGRRTWRNSLQTGGFPIKPVWKGRSKTNARFVLLCDGSRSMSSYADQFLQFAYALTACTRHVEVFLFSTKLKRVTPQLKSGKHGQLPVLTVFENEWGGGTRIGESLFSFIQQYSARMLRKETVVFIVSDGLDTGDIACLPRAMKEIKQRTSAVVWLNPLLKINGYQPEARGMKAALPYIDIFSEAQSPEEFERLARTMTIRR